MSPCPCPPRRVLHRAHPPAQPIAMEAQAGDCRSTGSLLCFLVEGPYRLQRTEGASLCVSGLYETGYAVNNLVFRLCGGGSLLGTLLLQPFRTTLHFLKFFRTLIGDLQVLLIRFASAIDIADFFASLTE